MHKIANFLDNSWKWLVVSSVNEKQISLTVKGFLSTGVSGLIAFLSLAHLQIPGLDGTLNLFVDQIILIVQYGLGIVGALSIIFGILRKGVILFKNLPFIRKPIE